MNLAKTIKAYRLSNKYTLKELASQINVTASFLSNIENSKKIPSIDTLSKLAEAYNIPLYILFKDYSDFEVGTCDNSMNVQDTFMLQARVLFLSDSLSNKGKEAIFKDISDLYWKSKGMLK